MGETIVWEYLSRGELFRGNCLGIIVVGGISQGVIILAVVVQGRVFQE